MAVTGLIFIGIFVLVAIFWLVIVTDGAYFGRRGVRFIYNRFAKVWNLEVSPGRLRTAANEKILTRLFEIPGILSANVLDVATGTARIPLLLATNPEFEGHVTGIDLSRNMLAKGEVIVKSKGVEDKVTLEIGDSMKLRWPDGTFDLVTCVEALEMLPKPKAAITEMVRVLKPGGTLVITKASDSYGKWKPGRAISQKRLMALFEGLGLAAMEVHQIDGTDQLVAAEKISRSHKQQNLASVVGNQGQEG
ncbi:MAG TPA: class I SAM-dependent methyltransferase [Actinomycetota bacterium]|nr:class I SAM-dependent methyltransferase [Actinomycetota bacterium]